MYDAVFTTWIGPALLLLAVDPAGARAARRPGPADPARGVRRGRARGRVGGLPGPGRLGEGRRRPAARRRDPDAGGLPRRRSGSATATRCPPCSSTRSIYQNWLRGEFGSPDVPQAQELGRDLLRAQTFTKTRWPRAATRWRWPSRRRPTSPRSPAGWATATPTSRASPAAGSASGVLAVIQAAVHRAVPAAVQGAGAGGDAAAAADGDDRARRSPWSPILKPDILPALLRVAGAAIVNTLVVGRAGRACTRCWSCRCSGPAPGIDLWLALLVTGRGDRGAVGGGPAVPAAGVDGVADPRAVRRDRAGRRAPGRCRGCGSGCAARRPTTTARPAGGTSGAARWRPRASHDAVAAGGRAGDAGAQRLPAGRARAPRRRQAEPPAPVAVPGRAPAGAAGRLPTASALRRRASRAGPTPARSTTG